MKQRLLVSFPFWVLNSYSMAGKLVRLGKITKLLVLHKFKPISNYVFSNMVGIMKVIAVLVQS